MGAEFVPKHAYRVAAKAAYPGVLSGDMTPEPTPHLHQRAAHQIFLGAVLKLHGVDAVSLSGTGGKNFPLLTIVF